MTNIDTDQTQFLRTICERPDDDAPRMVYADWLDEFAGEERCEACDGEGKTTRDNNGNVWVSECKTCHGSGYVANHYAERAEFIRVQIALANSRHGGIPKVQYAELKNRERELSNQYGLTWLPRQFMDLEAQRAEVFGVVQYSRGFISSISLTCSDFMQHAKALFDPAMGGQPITRVVLTDANSHLIMIAPMRGLACHWDAAIRLAFGNPKELSRLYATQQLALDALSDAAVRHGRGLAGLNNVEEVK